MNKHEIDKTSEDSRPNPPMPGHDVQAAWGKCDGDDEKSMPMPPPLWTRYMDSRLREYCKR